MKKTPKLFPHQQEALSRVLSEPLYALFMDPGTGKTAVAIKAIEKRYEQDQIERVMILAPSTILYNWELELETFLNCEYVLERLNHHKREKRLKLYNDFLKNDWKHYTKKELKEMGHRGTKQAILGSQSKKLMILLVNYEKARVMHKELKRFKPDMLIIDESHKLRGQNKTSRDIYKLTRTSKYRILMTGTPTCNGYEDLFMQYKLMDESIFGSSYKEFEYKYIQKGGYMNYQITGYKNVDELMQIVDNTAYRIKIEACIKLPPINYKFLYCELNKPARTAYAELYDHMLTTINTEITRKRLKQVCKQYGISYKANESYTSLLIKARDLINTTSCDLAITQIMRLQQICGGFITLDSGEVINISNDKLIVLKEAIADQKGPIVIFCQYVAEIELIVKELSKSKLRVASYNDTKNRDKTYNAFKSNKLDVLVLQISSGSVGLNLQEANKLIFYSWSYSFDSYKQAIARIKRSGQKRRMQIIHIVARDTIDNTILDAIKQKGQIAERIFTKV